VFQAFLVSTSVVALAEIGDKTQLLSLILAAHYRKPIPIVLGVLTATLANHAGAGAVGTWLSGALSPGVLNWAIVAPFVFMAGWILVPDRLDPNEVAVPKEGLGVYGTTAMAIPARAVHVIACLIFLILGGLALRNALTQTSS
jgi:Ca2+/H+ antiporter, TMEM165/GDT1 family